MPEKSGVRRIALPILLIGIAIFFVFIILSFFLIFILSKGKEEDLEEKGNIYQVSHLEPSSNKTNFGFVRINKKLSNEEYFSYYNPETLITSVVSEIHDTEYQCTGICFCEENFRRTSLPSISRGIFIILSAISVTMASNIAKDTFHNSCENKLVGICSSDNNIRSEVTDCEELKELVDQQNREFEEESEAEDDSIRQLRTYACNGHCLNNNQNLRFDTRDIDIERDGKNIKKARQSFGDCSKLVRSGDVEIIIDYTQTLIDGSNTVARSRFVAEYLSSFCRESSLVKVKKVNTDSRYYEKDGVKEKSLKFKEIETPACVGNRVGVVKNVKCKIVGKRFVNIQKTQ